MARCSSCARFSRFMETDEFAAPQQRTALVHPDGGVRIPSRHSADEPAFSRERHGDDGMVTVAAPPGYSPFHPPAVPAARPVSISLPASPRGFDGSREEAAPRTMLPPRATSAAIASIRYSSEVKNAFTQCMCIGLSAAATLTVAALFLTTLLHAVVHRDLFPNDISIAITERRRRKKPINIIPEELKLMMMRDRKKNNKAALSAAPADLEAATTSYT